MSFRGGRGGRGGGGRSFGRGRGGRGFDMGPPASVIEAGYFSHPCEGEAVVKLTLDKVPYFNAPIFLENKTQIGKVEEIFGLINSPWFTVKMSDGVVASSYGKGDKFYIDPMKLLPLERFLPQPKGSKTGGGGRGGGRGGGGRFSRGRGGRGFGGGRGGGRSFGRGGRGGGRSFGRGRGRGRF